MKFNSYKLEKKEQLIFIIWTFAVWQQQKNHTQLVKTYLELC